MPHSAVDPLDKYMGYLLKRASVATGAQLKARLAEISLRTVEATVLIFVDDQPGIAQSELSDALDMQRPNMTSVINSLEQQGLIVRRPIDGRTNGLHLAAKGQKQISVIRQIFSDFEQEDVLQRIPENLRGPFVEALKHLW